MATHTGTGQSTNRDPQVAAREATALALAPLGGKRPGLVLLFATAGYDLPTLVREVSQLTAGAPLSGCSAEGVITREGSNEGTHCVGLMAIASDELRFHTLSTDGVGADPAAAAERLAGQLPAEHQGKLLLLFPDGLTANCTALVGALDARVGPGCVVAGGTAGDTLTFTRTFQFHDGRCLSDGVAAVLISGPVEVELGISHGCDLIGQEQEITRAEGAFVQEIGGRPTWGFFKDFLDDTVKGLDALSVSHLALAERLPGPAVADYGSHAIRVPLRLDEASGAMFFPAGMTAGTRVQPALRNPEKIAERALGVAQSVAARRAEQPLLVLQFDCVGRGQVLYGSSASEQLIKPQIAAFPEATPWLGLHTYGEIAPISGKTWFHNFTAVLCALYPARA